MWMWTVGGRETVVTFRARHFPVSVLKVDCFTFDYFFFSFFYQRVCVFTRPNMFKCRSTHRLCEAIALRFS